MNKFETSCQLREELYFTSELCFILLGRGTMNAPRHCKLHKKTSCRCEGFFRNWQLPSILPINEQGGAGKLHGLSLDGEKDEFF